MVAGPWKSQNSYFMAINLVDKRQICYIWDSTMSDKNFFIDNCSQGKPAKDVFKQLHDFWWMVLQHNRKIKQLFEAKNLYLAFTRREECLSGLPVKLAIQQSQIQVLPSINWTLEQGLYKKLQPLFKAFSRTTLDFQGPPTRNITSRIILYKNAHSQSILIRL